VVKINCGYCERVNEQVIDMITIEMGGWDLFWGCPGVVAYTLRG